MVELAEGEHFLNPAVVYFEMFGMLNEHTPPHKKTYIDIKLIGAVDKDDITMISPEHLEILSKFIAVPLPQELVSVDCTDKQYIVTIDAPLFHFSFKKFDTFKEVTEHIQSYLDKANEKYKEEKGYLKYEGIVLQETRKDPFTNKKGMKYIKVKSSQFQDDFRDDGLTVPINEIRKEIQKIIRENLSTYEENYNEIEVIKTINEYLTEDYSETDIKNRKTQNVLKKELHKYIDSISNKSVNKIVNDILQHNESDMEIRDMMRYFGEHYPMMKHRTRDVYFVLSKRLKKGE